MVSISLKLGFDCPECKHPVPLGGLVARTRCDHCQSAIEPDWRKLLRLGNPALTVVQWALERPQQQQEKGGFGSIHLDLTRTLPQCACGVAWDPVPLAQAVGAGHNLLCPGCQAPITARLAPHFVRQLYPEIAVAVRETMTAEETGEPAPAIKPLLFGCMNCGAPLKIDGKDRVVECGSCESSNYLPDGLWLRLHPARKREPFWLLIQG